jgi:hypothetical protein
VIHCDTNRIYIIFSDWLIPRWRQNPWWAGEWYRAGEWSASVAFGARIRIDRAISAFSERAKHK